MSSGSDRLAMFQHFWYATNLLEQHVSNDNLQSCHLCGACNGKSVGTLAGLNYLQENGREKLWQSLVRHPCGALELFNFPECLRDVVAETGDEDGNPVKLNPVDLAAVDIFRDRERGIPRYNAFREQYATPQSELFFALVVLSTKKPYNTMLQRWRVTLRFGHLPQGTTSVVSLCILSRAKQGEFPCCPCYETTPTQNEVQTGTDFVSKSQSTVGLLVHSDRSTQLNDRTQLSNPTHRPSYTPKSCS